MRMWTHGRRHQLAVHLALHLALHRALHRALPLPPMRVLLLHRALPLRGLLLRRILPLRALPVLLLLLRLHRQNFQIQ